MKPHRSRFRLLFLVAMPFLPLTLTGASSSAPEVALVGMAVEKRAESGQPGSQPVLHAFGGRKVSIDLRLTGPAGASVAIEARLVSVANGLGAPLAPDIALGEVVFDHRRLVSRTVELPLPEVARKVQLAVRIIARTGSGATPVGDLRVFVYPGDLAAPLRQWAAKARQDGGLRLGVFGKSSGLRAFLNENGVVFEELGEKIPPPSSGKMLLVGDAALADLESWLRRLPEEGNARLVVFTEDPWRLPGVYVTTTHRLRIVKATLPILERLPTDPLHQISFVEIITQSSALISL